MVRVVLSHYAEPLAATKEVKLKRASKYPLVYVVSTMLEWGVAALALALVPLWQDLVLHQGEHLATALTFN